MDPNANLTEALRLAELCCPGEPGYSDDDVIRLADLVIGLDAWLANGGFLPDRWKRTEDSAS